MWVGMIEMHNIYPWNIVFATGAPGSRSKSKESSLTSPKLIQQQEKISPEACWDIKTVVSTFEVEMEISVQSAVYDPDFTV